MAPGGAWRRPIDLPCHRPPITGWPTAVAEHLQLFDGVLASDGETNLAGGNKLAAFRSHFGDSFCYIGNAHPDVELLRACESPMVANPHGSLTGRPEAGRNHAGSPV